MAELYGRMLIAQAGILQQSVANSRLIILAIVNAVAWVGLFLLMFWILNRRSKDLDDQITRLESAEHSRSTPPEP
jgi:hypothetical protein